MTGATVVRVMTLEAEVVKLEMGMETTEQEGVMTEMDGMIGQLLQARRRTRRKRRRRKSRRPKKRRRKKPPKPLLPPARATLAGLMTWMNVVTMHGADLLQLARRKRRAKYDPSVTQFGFCLTLF